MVCVGHVVQICPPQNTDRSVAQSMAAKSVVMHKNIHTFEISSLCRILVHQRNKHHAGQYVLTLSQPETSSWPAILIQR